MTKRRTLSLHAETLAALTTAELEDVVGATNVPAIPTLDADCEASRPVCLTRKGVTCESCT